jgi:polyether ionophore transport system permease protein
MTAASAALGAQQASRARARAALTRARALITRALRDARVRTLSFAYLFALYAYIQPIAYRDGYPTMADRIAFAHSFAGNEAVRIFYGEPQSLLKVTGYAAWRVGGTLAILAAIFGLFAAVRALRGEEDSGRAELVLAGGVGRRTAFLAAMGAVGITVAVLWLAELAGFVLAGLPLGGSAYLALATASVAPVGAGVGALASQLAPSRRGALELGGAVVGLLFVLRVIGDTAGGLGWLRWTTPLGWAEQLRPFAGERPLVLALPVFATALSLAVAWRLAAARDVGTGLLVSRERSDPRLGLLSSPLAQTLRSERGSVAVWLGSVGAFGYVLGVLAKVSSAGGISNSLNRELGKLGSGTILTPSGFVGFAFVFFVLIVSIFGCAQIAAARHEEAEGRLETLLALAVGRRRWLAGRLLLAACAAAVISLAAGTLTWAGAESGGASIPLAKLIEAGANCLPVALLFLGLAALAFAIVPRASAGIAYGLVALAFLWNLVGSLLDVPGWLVKLTPFAHVGLVPAQAFRTIDALVMLAIGLAAGMLALRLFGRRDLVGH